MSDIEITQEHILSYCLEMWRRGHTSMQISRFTGGRVPSSTIRYWASLHGVKHPRLTNGPLITLEEFVRGKANPTEAKRRKRFTTEFEDIFLPHLRTSHKQRPLPREHGGRVIIVSCLHVPFTNERYFDRLLNEKADGIIVAGDFLDCYSLARHPRRQHIPIQEELFDGRQKLMKLADRFPWVYLLEGNHEARSKAFFNRHIPADLFFLVETDLLGLVARAAQRENIFLVGREVAGYRTVNFLFVYGDAVIAHAQLESKIPMRPVETFHSRLMNWRKVLDLADWRAEILCHTHHLGKMMLPPNHVVFEAGCLTSIQEYAMDHRFPYNRPQSDGFVILEQDRKGVTDINASQFVFLGWG